MINFFEYRKFEIEKVISFAVDDSVLLFLKNVSAFMDRPSFSLGKRRLTRKEILCLVLLV